MEQIVRDIHENLIRKRKQMTNFKECLSKTNEYLHKTKDYLIKVDAIYKEAERQDEVINENLNKLFSLMNKDSVIDRSDCIKPIPIFNDLVYDRLNAEFEKDYTEAQEEEKMKTKRSMDSNEYATNNLRRSHSREEYYKVDCRNRYLYERRFDDRRNAKTFMNFKNRPPRTPSPLSEPDHVKNIKIRERSETDVCVRNAKNEFHEHKVYKDRFKSYDLKEKIKKPTNAYERNVHVKNEEHCDKSGYESEDKIGKFSYPKRRKLDESKQEDLGLDKKQERSTSHDLDLQDGKTKNIFHKHKVYKERPDFNSERFKSQEQTNKSVNTLPYKGDFCVVNTNEEHCNENILGGTPIELEPNPKRRKINKSKKTELKQINAKNVESDTLLSIEKDDTDKNIKESNKNDDKSVADVTLIKNKTDNDTCMVRNIEDLNNKEVILKSQAKDEIEDGEISELSNSSSSSSSSDSDTQSEKIDSQPDHENVSQFEDAIVEVVSEEQDYNKSMDVVKEFENVEKEVEIQTVDTVPASINDELLKIADKPTPSIADIGIESNSKSNTSLSSNDSAKQTTVNPNVINITLSRRRRKIVKLD